MLPICCVFGEFVGLSADGRSSHFILFLTAISWSIELNFIQTDRWWNYLMLCSFTDPKRAFTVSSPSNSNIVTFQTLSGLYWAVIIIIIIFLITIFFYFIVIIIIIIAVVIPTIIIIDKNDENVRICTLWWLRSQWNVPKYSYLCSWDSSQVANKFQLGTFGESQYFPKNFLSTFQEQIRSQNFWWMRPNESNLFS